MIDLGMKLILIGEFFLLIYLAIQMRRIHIRMSVLMFKFQKEWPDWDEETKEDVQVSQE